MYRKISFLGLAIVALLGFVLPSSAQSNLSESYDSLFLWVTLISAAVLVLVLVLWVLFIYRFSENNEETERTPISHSTQRKLEIGWTLVAILIVIMLMIVSYPVLFGGVDAAEDYGEGTGEIVVVEGTATWQWRFHLASGDVIEPVREGPNSVSRITVETNKVYTFIFYNSGPYIHSFYVHDLNIKMDVVPGVNNSYTFEVLQPDTYPILCAEFCGSQHSFMRGFIIAEDV